MPVGSENAAPNLRQRQETNVACCQIIPIVAIAKTSHLKFAASSLGGSVTLFSEDHLQQMEGANFNRVPGSIMITVIAGTPYSIFAAGRWMVFGSEIAFPRADQEGR